MSDVFVIIRKDGRAENCDERLDYFDILDSAYAESASADEDWNYPSMLILNGKVVVEHGLYMIAHQYGVAKTVAVHNAVYALKERHVPAWLAARYDEEGSNDDWIGRGTDITVSKARCARSTCAGRRLASLSRATRWSGRCWCGTARKSTIRRRTP